MKKFLAFLLAAMLLLSVGAVAVAEEETYTDASTVTIYKNYKGTGTSPAETFTLVQVGDGEVKDGDATSAPALGTITGSEFAEGAATSTGTRQGITIALPEYSNVGVYEYTLKETDNKNAGVTYYGSNIRLVVTVINDGEGKIRVAAVHAESQGNKTDTFENNYSAGTLKVHKTIAGTLGEKAKKFAFKVTLTAPEGKTVTSTVSYGADQTAVFTAGKAEITFDLSDGETMTISNIPYGVGYTVAEVDATTVEGVEMNGEYVVTKNGESGTINSTEATANFTNTKNGEIDTGITTDSLPYVMLLGFVILAGAALIIKRRVAHN